jgi:uncharacterized protein YdeI (YjbR/CyaY-like superfamily)
MKSTAVPAELPILLFERQQAWAEWLDRHASDSPGAWLRFAKKKSEIQSLSYAEALDVALCYGWIDSQKKSYDEASWLQKFTPRGPKSIWSKINREKVQALMEAGRMKPAGLLAVERAKGDGRWDAAYDSQSNATVPEDLQAALDQNPKALAFFATLDSANRYAILFRIHAAKKPETRSRKIAAFVAMLERNEKIHS